MNRKNITSSLIIALASMWLGQSALVDFFIVPTLFSEIDDFFQAGLLGIAIFSKLNDFEVIVASGILALFTLPTKKRIDLLLPLFISIILWCTAMLYFVYLTSKIHELTELWRKADLMGLQGLDGIADLQQEHQLFHRLYISIDSVKLFLLLTLIGLGILKGDKWN
jgi:hypothetical protein